MKIGEIGTNSEGNNSGNYVTGWNPDNDTISFFSTAGKQGNSLVYVPKYRVDHDPDWAETEVGWYDSKVDEDCEHCLNDEYPVPFGAGYYVNALSALSSKNPKLVFAGQVKTDTAEIPVYKFTIAGFCRPSAGTIADIETNSQGNQSGNYVTGWNPDNDTISFFSATGKQGNTLVYVPKYRVDHDPDWAETDVGWYDSKADEDCEHVLSTPLNPGDGFYVNALSALSGKNPSLWIKPAITADAE